MAMKRTKAYRAVAVLVSLVSLCAAGLAATVHQGAGDNFVALEAENYASITHNAGTKDWIVVSTASPITSPVGNDVIPVGSNVSGGEALLADYGISGHGSTVTYQIKFDQGGTYRMYVRYSMYESGTAPTNYGNEDSFYRPNGFNQLPPTGDTNIVSGFLATYGEGNYGWLNTGASYTVSAAEAGASLVTFSLDNRENGLTLDRIVFSTSTGLDSAALDALANGATLDVTQFTDGAGTGVWETAGNWDNGVPTSSLAAHVAGGLTATLSQTGQQAARLYIGDASGAGTVNQTGGDLTVSQLMLVGPQEQTGTYTATGGSLTVGQLATGRADMLVAQRTVNTSANTVGTVDLSGASSFNAYLDNLIVAWQTAGAASGGGGSVSGTLTLSPDNTIDANSIVVGWIDSGNISTTTGTLNLGLSNTISADLFAVGSLKGTGVVTLPAGGVLNLGSDSRRTELNVGYKYQHTSGSSNGNMDLSAGDQFNAYLSTVRVGVETGASGSGSSGNAIGSLKLAAVNAIDADQIIVGRVDGPSTASTYSGSMTLGTTSTSMLVNSWLIGGDKSTGTVTLPTGATLDLGSDTQRTDLWVGYKEAGTGKNSTGTLNLSGGLVTAYLSDLNIGRSLTSSAGQPTGTVTLGTNAANLLDISGSIRMADMAGDTAALRVYNGTVTVGGGVVSGAGTSTLELREGTMTVADGLSVGTLTVGLMDYDGGTATLTVDGGAVSIGSGSENVMIGRRTGTTGGTPMPTFQATADFSAASGVTINANQVLIGTISGAPSGEGTVEGDLILSTTGTNTIRANLIVVGDSSDRGSTVDNTIQFGSGTNIVETDLLRIGYRKTKGTMTVASGGTLTLGGKSGAAADLDIGVNVDSTGANNVSLLDTTGATLNATLDQVRIGRQLSGGGSGNGTLTFDAGTVTANDILLAQGSRAWGTIRQLGGTMTVSGNITDGGGTSALRIEGGTFNAGGDVTADLIVVGYDALSATMTMTASTAAIGSASNRVDLMVGRREHNTGTTFQGTLDASAVGSLTAYLDEFNVGTIPGDVGGSQGQPRGVVLLGASNFIDANVIRIGDSPSVGLGGFNNRIVMGADNTILTPTMIVGGNKSSGTIGGSLEFAAGGKLVLNSAGSRGDVWVGRQTVGTGGAAGLMDLSDATADSEMWIDQLVIGSKPNSATGTTAGVVSLGGGTMDVNDVILGQRNDAGSAGVVQGTFNLDGGTLIAGTIQKGAGNGNNVLYDQANFNFNAGRLAVGTFGTPAQRFDLDNLGTGTLAPGNSIGTTTVWGNYSQDASATLEIEIDGAMADLLIVNGLVSLDGGELNVLLGSIQEGGRWIILANDEDDPIEGTFTGLLEGATFYSPDNSLLSLRITYAGGDGNDIELTAVPEPASALLLMLAVPAVAARIRRRVRARV